MCEKSSENGISTYEMFQKVDWDQNTHEVEHDGKITTVLGENFGNCLSTMHEFAKLIQKSKELAFIETKNKFGKSVLSEQKFARYFGLLNAFIVQYHRSSNETPSEYVKLIFQGIEELCLEDEWFTNPGVSHRLGVNGADLFNSLISWIRKEANTSKFKKKINVREHNSTRNFNSGVSYFNALLDCYADLLVIRIDLSYREEHADQLTIEEVQKDLSRLWNNRRKNKLFSDMVGYIAKLEYKPKKGLHHHVIFFFNGAKRHKDEWLADQCGIYWRDCITAGRGIYHNCNADKKKYNQCGIGMIGHSDEEKRNFFIDKVLKYIVKKDEYLKGNFDSKIRVFTRGEMPRKRTNAGRPRKVTGK